MWSDRMIANRMRDEGHDIGEIQEYLECRAEERREQAKYDAYDEWVQRTRQKEQKDAEQMLLDRTRTDPFPKISL